MYPFSYRSSSSSRGKLLLGGLTSVTYSMDLHGHLTQVTHLQTLFIYAAAKPVTENTDTSHTKLVYKWIFLLMKLHFPMSVLISAKMETFYSQPVSQFQVQH